MVNLFVKLAPTLAVLGMVGYLCWSEAEDLPVQAKVAPKAVEISTAMLLPGSGPVPNRDPFQAPQALKAEGKKVVVAPAAGKPVAKEQLGTSFVLKGTFLQGTRRLALIDDRFYAEGEWLPQPKAGLSRYQVARVNPERVLLRDGTNFIELEYVKKAAKLNPSSKGSDGSLRPGQKGNLPKK